MRAGRAAVRLRPHPNTSLQLHQPVLALPRRSGRPFPAERANRAPQLCAAPVHNSPECETYRAVVVDALDLRFQSLPVLRPDRTKVAAEQLVPVLAAVLAKEVHGAGFLINLQVPEVPGVPPEAVLRQAEGEPARLVRHLCRGGGGGGGGRAVACARRRRRPRPLLLFLLRSLLSPLVITPLPLLLRRVGFAAAGFCSRPPCLAARGPGALAPFRPLCRPGAAAGCRQAAAAAENRQRHRAARESQLVRGQLHAQPQLLGELMGAQLPRAPLACCAWSGAPGGSELCVPESVGTSEEATSMPGAAAAGAAVDCMPVL